MISHENTGFGRFFAVIAVLFVMLAGCAGPEPIPEGDRDAKAPMYIIGPGDSVNIFVWGNPDLSATVPVRPDGRVTTPLVEDVEASGKTPTELARDMEGELRKYINNPVVTVIVTDFVGRFSEQIRVVGEATEPQALPFSEHMTALDVMIAVGGLTEFASGNNTKIIRKVGDGTEKEFRVRLDDLLYEGDISANVDMLPGDILVIPEAWF